MTYPPDTPRRILADLLTNLALASLAALALLALAGCYGAPIDTRDVDADEVTITTHTPWSQTTITAKGWRSRVKAQEQATKEAPPCR